MRLKLSSEGYLLDSTTTEAIVKFPMSSMLTDPRYFFGQTNQVTTSTDKIAALLQPYSVRTT